MSPTSYQLLHPAMGRQTNTVHRWMQPGSECIESGPGLAPCCPSGQHLTRASHLGKVFARTGYVPCAIVQMPARNASGRESSVWMIRIST